jgi:hypothetical protein
VAVGLFVLSILVTAAVHIVGHSHHVVQRKLLDLVMENEQLIFSKPKVAEITVKGNEILNRLRAKLKIKEPPDSTGIRTLIVEGLWPETRELYARLDRSTRIQARLGGALLAGNQLLFCAGYFCLLVLIWPSQG